jgi:hypothetical protein
MYFVHMQTPFNPEVLNIIYQLNHSNVLELLGVTLLGPFSDVCFQVLPLMTCECTIYYSSI